MGQQPHIEAGDSPADIGAGLAAGCYVAQPSGPFGGLGVRYATAETAPSNDADFFHCRAGEFFSFTVGDDQPATG